jgi:hypothetical protein
MSFSKRFRHKFIIEFFMAFSVFCRRGRGGILCGASAWSSPGVTLSRCCRVSLFSSFKAKYFAVSPLTIPLRQQHRFFSRHLFLSTTDDDDYNTNSTQDSKTVDSTWDIAGLKKEVNRLITRSHKKIGRASQRLTKAKEQIEELLTTPNTPLERLEECPDIESLEFELNELQVRLEGLNQLESMLLNVKNKKDTMLPPGIAALAVQLGVNDHPPARLPRGPPKPKGPRTQDTSRKPYRRYYSLNGTEIRVGKKAEDNDELSLNPKYRDGSDWWMHASGCPGSHVVIRWPEDRLPDNEVLQDAASLAARQSKCQGSVIKVSLTRCRDIKKPPGAKAGLVMLTGKVQTISVNMREAESRLERLESTVLVN